jgi:hypothetical protein
VIVGPSWGRGCGAGGAAAHNVAATSKATVSAAATRGLLCGCIEFGIMGTRMLNAFDLDWR